MLRTRRLHRSCKIAVLNSSIFWHFGLRWLIFRPIKSHTCDIAGHEIVWTASCCKKCCTIRALCGLACRPWTLDCEPTHDCRNGGLRVERAHYHGFFGLSDYHQERTSPTYSQRKNNPRQLHPYPQSSCAQNVVVLKWSVSLAPNPCTTVGRGVTKKNDFHQTNRPVSMCE